MHSNNFKVIIISLYNLLWIVHMSANCTYVSQLYICKPIPSTVVSDEFPLWIYLPFQHSQLSFFTCFRERMRMNCGDRDVCKVMYLEHLVPQSVSVNVVALTMNIMTFNLGNLVAIPTRKEKILSGVKPLFCKCWNTLNIIHVISIVHNLSC